MNSDYPLEVQRAEQTRYAFISADDLRKRELAEQDAAAKQTGVSHLYRDSELRPKTKPALWIVTVVVVAAAIALCVWTRLH